MAPRPRLPSLLLLLTLASACATPGAPPSVQPGPSEGSYPRVLTDDAGRAVTVETEPHRVVSLAPSNTEIVCALGACDRLVGVTDFDDYPPEVVDVPDVVGAAQVDVEKVIAAEPDLVLAAGNEITPGAVIEDLIGLGLTVLVLYPETLDELYADIELVGEALDRRPHAAEVVDEMRDRVAGVVETVAESEPPVTYYEVFYAEGAIYTAGDGSFIASLIELAGGEPVVGDAQGNIQDEALVAADPEVILLGSASYDPALSTPKDALAVVASRPGWGEMRAVSAGRVVPYLDDIVTTRPGPRVVDGLEALARAIHPGLFE